MAKRKFKIYDWAGNLMPWGTFETSEEAFEAIYERFPDDYLLPDDEQWIQEFEVRS